MSNTQFLIFVGAGYIFLPSNSLFAVNLSLVGHGGSAWPLETKDIEDVLLFSCSNCPTTSGVREAVQPLLGNICEPNDKGKDGRISTITSVISTQLKSTMENQNLIVDIHFCLGNWPDSRAWNIVKSWTWIPQKDPKLTAVTALIPIKSNYSI